MRQLIRYAFVCLLLANALEATAQETKFGRPGDPQAVTRTIDVDMNDDMAFIPSKISVREGETVRFNVKNSGKMRHEMVIGTMAELKEHAEMMRKNRGMKHDAPYMAHVARGESGVITWQFTKTGTFHYACLIRDHFQRGMVGEILVTSK